jgi:hypothetical protein
MEFPKGTMAVSFRMYVRFYCGIKLSTLQLEIFV